METSLGSSDPEYTQQITDQFIHRFLIQANTLVFKQIKTCLNGTVFGSVAASFK